MTVDQFKNYINQENIIGSGMEASVYHVDDKRVLKVYNESGDLSKQKRLKYFYENLIYDNKRLELPQIFQVEVDQRNVLTLEKRIEGEDLQQKFSTMNLAEQDEIMDDYLESLFALGEVQLKDHFFENQLFVPVASKSGKQDWYHYLGDMLQQRDEEIREIFLRDVDRYAEKREILLSKLSKGYQKKRGLIHGDFFPGNVMVDEQNRVSGIIDFGMLTMYGDPLFDVMIAWACFDMYDDWGIQANDRILKKIRLRLGDAVTETLYLYLLIYSLMTANLYSATCSDGHYEWCINHLNDKLLWQGVAKD